MTRRQRAQLVVLGLLVAAGLIASIFYMSTREKNDTVSSAPGGTVVTIKNAWLGQQTEIIQPPLDREGIIRAHNEYRAKKGLSALTESETLDTSAMMKAKDMVEKNYWAHTAPDGTLPWYWFELAGYKYVKAGENLAFNFQLNDTVVEGWVNSPEHLENIVGDYQSIGVAVLTHVAFQGETDTNVVVAHYGTPRE